MSDDKTEAQPVDLEALKTKVQGFLTEAGVTFEVRPDGSFGLRQGSTFVIVQPLQWNERTLVRVFAPVALECTNLNPGAAMYLAEQNAKLIFGKFSLDTEESSVWYEHALLGDFLDKDELITAVMAVALTTDQYDEQIATITGGKRVADL
ncbi:MAG: YbjN domain-containing protein [Chloroflexi bacterium]|nr:YbjN domain-containing protein [Chloroflexota bacterium]